MPADPFEAELLMMAETLATAEKGSEADSDSEDEDALPSESEVISPFQCRLSFETGQMVLYCSDSERIVVVKS